MWLDKEAVIDQLGFEHLVAAVAFIVNNEMLAPATMRAYGDSGSRKSSLVTMISQQFEGQEGNLLLSFSGWLFWGTEKSQLMAWHIVFRTKAARRMCDTCSKRFSLDYNPCQTAS
jgi:hypothetical protein